MKKTTKLAAILLSVISASALFSSYDSVELPETQNDNFVSFEDIPAYVFTALEQQGPAIEAFDALHTEIPFVTGDLEPIYPANYAGEYLDDNTLIVNITDGIDEYSIESASSALSVTEYMDLMNDSTAVEINVVEYSLNNLIEMYNQLIPYLFENYDVAGLCIDQRANQIKISVLENDYQNLLNDTFIQNNIDMLDIEIGEYAVACTNMFGGNKITNAGGIPSSIGIGGSYNGEPAILTCGHGFEVGDSIYFNGTKIGEVEVQRCNQSEGHTTLDTYGDFSIVPISNSQYVPTHRVQNATSTTEVVGTYSSLLQGADVLKYGCIAGYAWGEVLQTNYYLAFGHSEFQNDYFVSGLTQSILTNGKGTDVSAQGDSGGPIYTRINGETYMHSTITASRKEYGSSYVNAVFSSPVYYAEINGFDFDLC